MTIDHFKTLTLAEKLKEVKYNGNIVGPYDRSNEEGGAKVPGDIYEVHDFWVYISEDELTVIPSRRCPTIKVIDDGDKK
ncbi:MAG: hypothetical protein WCP65_03070 [Bacteroidota bacterium]|jgi:hypothetical protein